MAQIMIGRTCFVDPFRALKAASELPAGHYDKKKAQDNINRIYEECHKQERLWFKKSKLARNRRWRYLSKEDAEILLAHILSTLGESKVIRLFPNSKMRYGVGAYYFKRGIYYPGNYIGLKTLCHEVSHHWAHGHGEWFCEVERMVFEAVDSFVWKDEFGESLY